MPAVRPSADWSRYAVEFGHSLKRLRGARGFSQERLAYEAGLSRYTYQKFEPRSTVIELELLDAELERHLGKDGVSGER